MITGRIVGSSGPTALPVPTVGQVVENVTALRALVGSVDLPVVGLVQHSADSLLGGGMFAWRTTAAVDDGGTRFNAGGLGSSGEGWQRVYSGPRDVTWFGATGDGVTDDRAALILAHESLRDTGGELFFPAGDYRISAAIEWVAATVGEYDGITWRGEGRASHVFIDPGEGAAPATGVGMLSFLGERTQWADESKRLQGLTLRDMRFTGTTEASGGSGIDIVMIHIDQSRGARLVNLFLYDHPREGIHFGDARRNNAARIEGCHAERVGGYGASIGQYTAAYNPNCDDVVMLANVAHQCGCAVEFTGRSGVFIGNEFEDIGWTDGVFTRGSPAFSQSNMIGFATPSDRVVLTGNTVKTAGAALTVETATSVTITNNTIDSCNSGITVGDEVLAGVVSGNALHDTISGSGGTAIKIGSGGATSGAVTVAGNTITAGATPWAYIIDISDETAGHVVRDNTMVGQCFTTRGIRVDSLNTAARVIDNEFVLAGWAVYGAAVFYEWRGQNLTYNAGITGITGAVTLSTSRPSSVSAAAPPTIGTWSVGDRCVNTSATGISEWVCTVAGTPGTWGPVGAGAFAPGSCALIDGQWYIQYQERALDGTEELVLDGDAEYIITDL